MQTINAIIIDDEPLALKVIESHAQKIPFLNIVYSTTKVLEALSYLQNNTVDLIFLDIQMPDLTGLQLMDIINEETKIIIISAYSEYAVKGFEYEVIDYLLKPVSLPRMIKAVQKVRNLLETYGRVMASPAGIQEPGLDTRSAIDCIFVKTEYRLQKISFNDILYLEGGRDYVTIATTAGNILTLSSLAKLIQSLPFPKFIRVHKSYIVAIDKINYIERQRIYLADQIIPIGELYKDELSKHLNGT